MNLRARKLNSLAAAFQASRVRDAHTKFKLSIDHILMPAACCEILACFLKRLSLVGAWQQMVESALQCCSVKQRACPSSLLCYQGIGERAREVSPDVVTGKQLCRGPVLARCVKKSWRVVSQRRASPGAAGGDGSEASGRWF